MPGYVSLTIMHNRTLGETQIGAGLRTEKFLGHSAAQCNELEARRSMDIGGLQNLRSLSMPSPHSAARSYSSCSSSIVVQGKASTVDVSWPRRLCVNVIRMVVASCAMRARFISSVLSAVELISVMCLLMCVD